MIPALDVCVPTCDRPVELATMPAGPAAQEHPFGLVMSDRSRVAPSYGHPIRMGRHLPRRGPVEHRAALLERSRVRYVLFLDDREVLHAVGGFDFWPDLPESHYGENVLVQQRMMARAGGAGILPSGTYHRSVRAWDAAPVGVR